MGETYLSIIIPAYNEERRILNTIRTVESYLSEQSYPSEIIVVDDGSIDNTMKIVSKMRSDIENLRIVSNGTNRGKGFSVRNGFLNAKGKFLIFSDADLSTPIEEVEKLLQCLQEGFDVAIGSRGLKESDIRIRQPWHRERMGRVFNLIVRILTMGDFNDTQCGFKAFTTEAALNICEKQLLERFSFDVEMLYIAKKFGYKIKEVPIQWFDDPRSKVNNIRDSYQMFTDLIRIRINDFKGLYG